MKNHIEINNHGHFPYFGNGINYHEELFGLKFDAQLIQKTSDFIWNDDSTLPKFLCKPLPGKFSAISDLAQNMTVNLNGNKGLIGKFELFKEVERLDPSLMDGFIEIVQNHLKNPSEQSSNLIADFRCWSSWLANGIKIEPIFNGEKKANSFIPWPLAGILLLSSKILGQQPEFEYAADYVLRSGILPKEDVNALSNSKQRVDYIRSIKPIVAFHDFDGNEQGFRMTHLAMEETSRKLLSNASAAILKDEFSTNSLNQMEEALYQSNQLFNCMWDVSNPELYNKEVRIFIQGLNGNQGSIYDENGLFFENCGNDSNPTYNSKGLFISNLHGQTGANSSYYPIADEITGIGNHTRAYVYDEKVDPIIIEKILFSGNVANTDLPENSKLDSLSRLLKSFRVGYRPPSHHKLIVNTRNQIQNSTIEQQIQSDNNKKKALANCIRWIIQHRIDHYSMVVSYILKSPDPYSTQTKNRGTGGSPTPSFLPSIFLQTIERLNDLVENNDEQWVKDILSITDNHQESMNSFIEIAKKSSRKERLS